MKMYAINATVVQTVPGGRIIDPDGRYAELDICAKEVYCSAEEV